MNQYQNRIDGFTLIELLAVIVILAVIALIATPLVLNIIERAEKGAFKDSVYGIMEAAEFQVILDDSKYPITYTFPEYSNRIQFKGTKPTEGFIQIVTEGKMKLALGNGRWCAIKDVSDSQVTLKNGKCEKIELNQPIISGYGALNQEINMNETYTMPNVTAVDKSGNPLNVTTTIKQGDKIVEKIDTSKEGSYTIAYTTEPDKEGNTSTITVTINIIKQETDTDKMIEEGLENGTLELIGDMYYYRGTNPDNWIQFNDELWRIIGMENGMLKIIRNQLLDVRTWDQSKNDNWAKPATLNTYLNSTYYDTLQAVAKNQIQKTIFSIGSVVYSATTTASALKEEEKKVKWTGYVGLMNASDYVYASMSDSCQQSIFSNSNCNKDNWLYNRSYYQWTINASTDISSVALMVTFQSGIKRASVESRYELNRIRPVLFLKSSIVITSGNGKSDSPYIISGS